MYTPSKHSLPPESLASSSSSYPQKRRRIVQHTPVPEKYLYRPPQSRLSASRGSSIRGDSEARDGISLGSREWANSPPSEAARSVAGGDNGDEINRLLACRTPQIKKPSFTPESPFERILSRQKQSRGVSTTTSLRHRSSDGSLRSSDGARIHTSSFLSRQSSLGPLHQYCASTQHTHTSPTFIRPSTSDSQRVLSPFRNSAFEFCSPSALPKLPLSSGDTQKLKARSDSLLSFFGDAVSRAKLALASDRELQKKEREIKLKEDAHRRAVEAERRKRDEVFAKIAREEEEEELGQAINPFQKGEERGLHFRSTGARRYPPPATTRSNCTTTVTLDFQIPRRQEHELASTESEPIGYASERVTVTGGDEAIGTRRAIILSEPAREILKPVMTAKSQPEVICLDSDDDEGDEDLKSHNMRGARGPFYQKQGHEVGKNIDGSVHSEDFGEGDGEYDDEYDGEEGGYEDEVEEGEDEEDMGEEDEEEEDVGEDMGEEDMEEEGEEEGEENEEEEYRSEVIELVEIEDEETEKVEKVELGALKEHQNRSGGGIHHGEEGQGVQDLRLRFGASQAPICPPGGEESPTERDEESFRADCDDGATGELMRGEQDIKGVEDNKDLPQAPLNSQSPVESPTILTSQLTFPTEDYQSHQVGLQVSQESRKTQLYEGDSGAALAYSGQNRDVTLVPELKSHYGFDDGSATEIDRYTEFHSQSDARERSDDLGEGVLPDDLIEERTIGYEEEIARGGNQEFVEENEQEDFDHTKVKKDKDVCLGETKDSTVRTTLPSQFEFLHFHEHKMPQCFESLEEENTTTLKVAITPELHSDIVSVDATQRGGDTTIRAMLQHGESLGKNETQLDVSELGTKVPDSVGPDIVEVIDGGEEVASPQLADSIAEAASRTTADIAESEEEEIEVALEGDKEQRPKEPEKGEFSLVPHPISHDSLRPPSPFKWDGFAVVIDNFQEKEGPSVFPESDRGKSHERNSTHPIDSTLEHFQNEMVKERELLGSYSTVTIEEDVGNTIKGRNNTSPTLNVSKEYTESPIPDQLSPTKLEQETVPGVESNVMNGAQFVAVCPSPVLSNQEALQPKRKRQLSPGGLGEKSRGLPCLLVNECENKLVQTHDERGEVQSSPRKKKQRQMLGRKSPEPFSVKIQGQDDVEEAVLCEQVIPTSGAVASHVIDLPHNSDIKGMELRDGKVIPHPGPASRRTSPVIGDSSATTDRKLEGPALIGVATGEKISDAKVLVHAGKELRDGKVLAPLSIPSTPSKRRSSPVTPTTSTPKSATSPYVVRDRPLLFGAPLAPIESLPRLRTPSPKRRQRTGSNASSAISTPEVKSLRNRDVVVSTPIVEERDEGSIRGSSVEYEKRQLRRRKGSAENSPRKSRGRK